MQISNCFSLVRFKYISPKCVTLIDKIESVQRQFTKRLPGCSKLSYLDRLKICNLETVEYRSIVMDLCLVFKIVYGLIAIPFNSVFEHNTNQTRGHKHKITVPNVKTTTRQHFFSVRVISAWNALPEEVIQSASIYSFKCRLKKIDLTKYLIIN